MNVTLRRSFFPDAIHKEGNYKKLIKHDKILILE